MGVMRLGNVTSYNDETPFIAPPYNISRSILCFVRTS